MRIALLGAPGTGKTALAQALPPHLPPDWVVFDAPADPRGHDAVLLMALDLPGASAVAGEDHRLRESLRSSGVAYRVIYGRDGERLAGALRALGLAPPDPRTETVPWACERCGDGQCEHRLFTRLLAERSPGTP